jgi:hypothetical protein
MIILCLQNYKMVQIILNIEKRYVFLIVGILIVLAGVFAYVSSPGGLPNPGHFLSGVQGYFSGDNNLQDSLGKFCQSDGTNCAEQQMVGYVTEAKITSSANRGSFPGYGYQGIGNWADANGCPRADGWRVCSKWDMEYLLSTQTNISKICGNGACLGWILGGENCGYGSSSWISNAYGFSGLSWSTNISSVIPCDTRVAVLCCR